MDTGDLLARNRFQSGLLTWLRAHAPHEYASGLREMIAVTRSLAAVGQSGSGDGLLWRSAGSFLQALLDGSLQTDDEARTLCRRLERQLANRSAEYRRDNADTLAQAIFAFVSNRDARHDSANSAPPAAIQDNNGFNAMLSDAFAATADILPCWETLSRSDAPNVNWSNGRLLLPNCVAPGRRRNSVSQQTVALPP